MARSHARVLTRIWTRDEDFRALSLSAQWLYLFLLSQPDLNHAGLIPMRLRRWAGSMEATAARIAGNAKRG